MYTEHTFPSGVRLVVNSRPYGTSAAMGIYVRNGSRDEQPGQEGISHFIEHMLFKGTPKRSARDIAEEMDVMGGQLNAYTTKEYTCYYARVLNDNFQQAADILQDMYFSSLFDEEDIRREASVITEEINMYEDTPDELVFDELQKGIWRNNNPLGKPILGTVDSVTAFKRKDFLNYMKGHYRPDNTVVAVAGNVQPGRVIDCLGKYFGNSWATQEYKIFPKAEYVPFTCRRHKDIEQVHMCISYRGIPVGDRAMYDMNVLNTLLGGSMSSRLYQSIREEHALAYSIYSYMSCYMDAGIFTIYAAVNPDREELAKELIFNELEAFKRERISGEVLEKAKSQIKSNYLLGQEGTINLMEALGRSLLLQNKVIEADTVVERINAVTLDSLYALVEDTLREDMVSISVVGR